MKMALRFLVILTCAIISCTTDLDLYEPAQPIPIVYFQMNPDDQMLYLTATKTFSGNSDAYDMARDTEKLFYSTVDIRLETWIDDYKVTEIRFEPFDRHQLPGPFSENPGYCFKAKAGLNQRSTDITHFRLIIQAPGLTSPSYAKIAVIGPPIIQSRYDKQISLYPGSYNIGIAPGPGTAYCDLWCVFRYQQYEGEWINHSDTILIRRNIQFEAGRTDLLYPELFFKQIADNIRPINDTIIRKFTSLDLVFYASDQYFRDYVDTYVNAGNLDLPPKGNIVNGLGLFTMVRVATKENMAFDRITFDSLCLGQYTRQLGFVRW
jgi:hypothetical protein